jgi:hypothetical protein
MEELFEKIILQLRPFIKKQIHSVSVDGIFIGNDVNQIFGENIQINFSNDCSLCITTDYIPHFYGEGDLELHIVSNKFLNEPNSKFMEKEISEIKIFGWRKNGYQLFKIQKYFVQIEFYHFDEILLSSGFFYFDTTTKKSECLITGELAVDTIHRLLDIDFKENLSFVAIS